MTSTIVPGVLIAAPQLYDPNFDRTIVLMCDHSDEGAMGLVINRPSPVSMDEVFKEIQLPAAPKDAPPVLVGGPVQPERGWVVHGPEADLSESMPVADGIYLSSSRTLLETLSKGGGPRDFHLVLGYSGWGPGQLEAEITAGAWIIGKVYPDLVFRVPADRRWEKALADLGIDPAHLSDTVGEA